MLKLSQVRLKLLTLLQKYFWRTEDKVDWKSYITAMPHAYSCMKNANINFSPYFLMFGRHPRLPINVAFGLHRTHSNVAFSKSRYWDDSIRG